VEIILVFLIIIVFTSIFFRIKIKIDYLKLDYNKNDLEITIFFTILKKINIIIYKRKIEKNEIIVKDFSSRLSDRKKYKNIAKYLKFRIEEFKLGVNIGLSDVMLTTYSVVILSSLISILTLCFNDSINHENIHYKVKPVYNKTLLQLDFSSIISLKFTHIIYIIYKIIKERRVYNGRTSNRKSYGFCND